MKKNILNNESRKALNSDFTIKQEIEKVTEYAQ